MTSCRVLEQVDGGSAPMRGPPVEQGDRGAQIRGAGCLLHPLCTALPDVLSVICHIMCMVSEGGQRHRDILSDATVHCSLTLATQQPPLKLFDVVILIVKGRLYQSNKYCMCPKIGNLLTIENRRTLCRVSI